jgi:hypothetical protein
LKVRCDKPHRVISDCKGLTIEQLRYDEQTSRLDIDLRAKNIQGEIGNIVLQY